MVLGIVTASLEIKGIGIGVKKWYCSCLQYNIKMGQHHDSAPSLNYSVISIDSLHMRKDGSNDLKFLLKRIVKS